MESDGARRAFDGEAFATLFITQHVAALRYARLLTSDGALADEAVARGFLALYRRWLGEAVEDPGAYLRHAIAGEVANAIRRRAVEHRLVRREPQDGDVLLRALKRLPPQQQTAIVLRYFAALDERFAPRRSGTPVDTTAA